jgi:hypothetical protein
VVRDQGGIEPHVWVRLAIDGQDRDAIGQHEPGRGGAGAGHEVVEEVIEARAVGDDQIRVRQHACILGPRLVVLRSDTSRDERDNDDAITADLAHDVREDGRGGDDVQDR